MSGRVLCCISAMKYPRNFCGVISCAVHMFVVGCNVLLFIFPDFVTCAGNSFLYLLSSTVLIYAPESILTGSGLHPCLVIICSIMWRGMSIRCKVCGKVEFSSVGGWLVGEMVDLVCTRWWDPMAVCRVWSPAGNWFSWSVCFAIQNV